MPWNETSPMDQKTQFIADYLRQTLVHHRAVRTLRHQPQDRLQVDRPLPQTGPAGLEERSRRPHSLPSSDTPEHRRAGHPRGSAAVIPLGARRSCCRCWPSAIPTGSCPRAPRSATSSAATDWCPRTAVGAASATQASPPRRSSRPNDVWSADFKGQFKTGDGIYCYPLTVTDGFSRFLLGCQGAALDLRALTRSRCSRGCSRSTACPSASAPTTACPSPPPRSHAFRSSRPGGCAWASCPS